MHAVCEAQILHLAARRGAARMRRNMRRKPMAAHGMAQRRADQAHADQRHAIEQGGHAQKVLQCRHHAAIGLFAAHGQSQRAGKAIGIHAAQHDTAARPDRHRRRRHCASHPAGNAPAGNCRRSASPSGPAPASSRVSQGSHCSLCAMACSTKPWSAIAADARGQCRRAHVEGAADAVQHIGHMGGQ